MRAPGKVSIDCALRGSSDRIEGAGDGSWRRRGVRSWSNGSDDPALIVVSGRRNFSSGGSCGVIRELRVAMHGSSSVKNDSASTGCCGREAKRR